MVAEGSYRATEGTLHEKEGKPNKVTRVDRYGIAYKSYRTDKTACGTWTLVE